jgi:hypothetical protein
VHRTVAAVEELLRAAKHRARATGQTVAQVLQEHQEALEEQEVSSKFVAQTGGYSGAHESGKDVRDAMLSQDERRASHTFSQLTLAAARAVDSAESSRMVVPYVAREELRGAEQNTSVLRLPAAADRIGGETPNADRLRLMAPPQAPKQPSRPLKLRHNPSGGGGMHNPVAL